jgi:hypothetical protein
LRQNIEEFRERIKMNSDESNEQKIGKGSNKRKGRLNELKISKEKKIKKKGKK